MNILLPVHHFPPRYSAGAELYTFRLARWLQAHGHHVEVASIESINTGATDHLDVVQDSYEGIVVHRLSFNLLQARERKLWDYDCDLLGDWFASFLQRTQPDLVHFQAGYLLGAAPIAATHAAGIPMALTLHDYWFICPRITLQHGDESLCETIPNDPAGCAWCMKLEQRRFQVADRLTAGVFGRAMQTIGLQQEQNWVATRRARLLPMLKLFAAVIAPSQFMADQFAPYINSERMHVWRYGLDLAQFAAAHHTPSDTLRIGLLGQIAPHKGVHLLVEAASMLQPHRPFEIHIHGGLEARPDYVARLRALAAGRANIFFHGRFENSRAGEILSGLDLAVVPSTWYENSPLSILEAHAAGTPVVTAAMGGMAELVRDGVDGMHFRPADATDLARKIQHVIDDPGLLERLREGVRTPRTIDDEMDEITALYNRLVPHTIID